MATLAAGLYETVSIVSWPVTFSWRTMQCCK